MKEKLETIRNTAREMLMRPGGIDGVEWGSIWRLACRVLDELERDNERKGVIIPVRYGMVCIEIVQRGDQVKYDAVVRLSDAEYLGITFVPDEGEGEDEETPKPSSSA